MSPRVIKHFSRVVNSIEVRIWASISRAELINEYSQEILFVPLLEREARRHISAECSLWVPMILQTSCKELSGDCGMGWPKSQIATARPVELMWVSCVFSPRLHFLFVVPCDSIS